METYPTHIEEQAVKIKNAYKTMSHEQICEMLVKREAKNAKKNSAEGLAKKWDKREKQIEEGEKGPKGLWLDGVLYSDLSEYNTACARKYVNTKNGK